ncbi:3-hydroxyacyl-CoA dehydrogenase NAD-binding domain-containing protein (plasmid) [Paenarthrobacter sp. OM7]|uniref:3-hydroxyacyl-CoA dehydrogenase NAD-binding domain-containing protein n=1 Tax=Paenarthrobacter sp. OM7 TaxID=3041264 RepID=UPI0024694513|nr:3-hydroxyacyl-CoA dehydrogenase NAD-binding domain-containing protein [Paenarthrobacter sp. OM7]WGM22928.1 3-hydroxyacyl-CoA dehydrogenase NAD-binding domain-containing protein [Paenarthrobacter sp. OM7]
MTDETITHVRISHHVHNDVRIALLTLDNGSRRPVTLGPASLSNLSAALTAVDLEETDALAITGVGRTFCAGADLKQMALATTVAEADEVAATGLEVLGQLRALNVPTFAFLNGTALGGGLELALHADYRTAAASVPALGLPEVRLGLIPGWGGIPLATAALGTTAAAKLIVSDALNGRTLSAPEALSIGLVDAVFPDDDFLDASLRWAADIVSGQEGPKAKPAAVHDPAALQSVRKSLDKRLRGAAPAPYRALGLIEAAAENLATGPTPASQQEEVRAFGELLLSFPAGASRYALTITGAAAKQTAVSGAGTAQPRSIRTVGVVGAGRMASQLALLFASQLRVPVLLTDVSTTRIDSALEWIGQQTDKLVARGLLSAVEAQEICGLVRGATDKAAFADRDLVIEAVFEELGVKREVFAQVEEVVSPEAILLTNTSSLSIADIAAGLTHPERLVGFHFFNPVDRLQLVELITLPGTDPAAAATALTLANDLNKVPVLVKDKPGFVVNRLLTRLISEALQFIDEGADPYTVDHALDPVGLPMTPLQLLQFIGPAVQQHIGDTMHDAYPERFTSSTSLKAIVAAGLPGYLDEHGHITASAAAFLPDPAPVSAELVRTRIMGAMAEETSLMLKESLVAGPEQIDLCMILGANFPFHTGGLTPLLDRETGTRFRPIDTLTKETV